MGNSILVIEDDVKIAESICEGLQQSHFACTHVTTGAQAVEIFASDKKFQLIVTDLMLPDGDGLELIEKLRTKDAQIPVLILSAKRSLDDRVLGLEKGGDDYMVKPFAIVELVARINNLLKRTVAGSPTGKLSFEDVQMNLLTREVHREGKKIELQVKEFALLEYFIRNPNTPLSKKQILEKIWGYNFDPQTNVVDVLVYRLRNKIDKDFKKSYLHTLRGIGYVLKSE